MTDDELAEIRRRKRERLERRLDEGAAGARDVDGGTSTPTEPIHVRDADHLHGLTGDHDVVLVDFHAEWCGPCKMLEPTVEALARETPAAVAKVDVDAHPRIASEYGVQSMPTLLLFADGRPVERVVGVRDESTLAGLVGRYA